MAMAYGGASRVGTFNFLKWVDYVLEFGGSTLLDPTGQLEHYLLALVEQSARG